MISYRLVHSNNPNRFQFLINELLEEGFVFIGDCMRDDGDSTLDMGLYTEMVKYAPAIDPRHLTTEVTPIRDTPQPDEVEVDNEPEPEPDHPFWTADIPDPWGNEDEGDDEGEMNDHQLDRLGVTNIREENDGPVLIEPIENGIPSVRRVMEGMATTRRGLTFSEEIATTYRGNRNRITRDEELPF